MVKKTFLLLVALALLQVAIASPADSTKTEEKKTKTGWTFGAVPAIAYDSDIGFKYGGLVNFYDYGDGTTYPDYRHSIYLEWSRTTKGSGITQATYDSKYLIPGVRVSGEVSYLTEQALDFYGFNGYNALYNANFEDNSTTEYRSRVYYRQDRKLLRLRADFQGKLMHPDLSWIAGISHYNVKLDTVDIAKLNEGKTEKLLPAINGGLYGEYISSGVLPEEYTDGGSSTFIKFGAVYDTRDNEPNPMHGVWTSLVFYYDPGFLGESPSYLRYALTHRQYFTLLPDRLSFAYRVGYQGILAGEVPSYMLPFQLNYGRSTDRDGFGGSKTMRGILRDRVVGNDVAFGNFELRWKFFRGEVLNQNVYLALSGFTDLGLVTRDYDIQPTTAWPAIVTGGEGLHQSVGGGFRVALNENFIVAVDYGVALDERDGSSGLYINLDWLF
ncbi:MAG: BamA/TamA family outer membrane protein [Bacteroidales bacterium]|nr:BamA/TamA family outer membrane protein [Bacteroidales bacterium]MBN2819413.1 BamA/TamA family outer membrane protein [Bacteroidales bacterium]